MVRVSKVAGFFAILALLCAAGVFIIEEVRYIPKESEFTKVEILADAININTATKEELENLDGIGASAAERIIEFRTEQRPFDDVYELTLVRGIGAKTIEKNIGRIKVR